MPPLRALLRPAHVLLGCNVLAPSRALFATGTSLAKQFPPRRVILDEEIEENFLRGTGPGGQKINKTSCAVQLKHLPTGIVVKCQETRSRSQNRKIARKILGERIEETELGDQSRTAIKARERSKRKASADKKKRRKYRELDAAKECKEGEGNAQSQHHAERAERAESEVISPGSGG